MADTGGNETPRVTSAFLKRQEQLQRWNQSETAREPVYKPTKRNIVNFDDGTVFLSAASAGDLEEVKKLLQKGSDVNYQNSDGLTALHQACVDENYDLVELLVQNKADLEVRDNEGWTALHAAASSGNIQITEFLIEHGADIAAVNNEGELPLDLSEEDEMEEYLQNQLRKANIDVKVARAEEERIMEEHAQSWLNKGHIDAGQDPTTGATPLHIAAAKEYKKVVSLLLQAGADPNAKDFDKWTPLHAAAHWGQKESCKLLADYGADFTLRNHVGLTPIDIAEPEIEKYLEELKKKQMEKPKINASITPMKNINSGQPPLTRRRSITRIKDTGLSKTDVNQERKALSERITPTKDVPKESHEDTTNNKHSSSSAETDSEESETSEESSEEASEGQEIMLRATTKIISKKPGSESDSESEKNPKNSIATQNGSTVANSPRTRNPTFLPMNNKNAVSTSARTNSYTSRPINSVARTYPAVERREDTGSTKTDKFGLNRGGRVSRSEDGDSTTRDLDTRRKLFEWTSNSYFSRLNNEDSKDSRGSDDASKINEDNSKKEEESRPSYRSQLRDSKLSSYTSRVRPSSRNFDDDKSKLNDVDSSTTRRNNISGRSTIYSDRDKDKNETSTSSYTSRRRLRGDPTHDSSSRDTSSRDTSTRDTTSSRYTSSYLRSTSSDNFSSRISEREKERQREAEKEKENENQSEKEKQKEKETEKESVDKSASRVRKSRRPREKRRSTGVAYMPSESDEDEPDELQEAKKNTMMNEDIEEKEKPKEETRSQVDRIRAGRTVTSTSTTDRFKNSSRISDSKSNSDVNTLQDKLRETQIELDETKTKLEKTVQEKNKLERKLENMEDDLKQLNDLREDNKRLKDENGALIRVISKLSRTPT
ncbi:protein phosphatase 1 regulatory subunit 12B-like isoform X1 [Xenia sp. Carnegie-2017]|uniref:protein phosphatase 1 regulatory subunit 12B-like isoform X1 n=1 Tax=Xenia sp. Carnegie-2017 TaxID=2897299 RepID=UPI001F0464E3|nr:protein phosphatase 1 regulatory subunit 12B-like isoform X1 [Xenia sp. Carnegie-2017]